jgi:hypothetical protein
MLLLVIVTGKLRLQFLLCVLPVDYFVIEGNSWQNMQLSNWIYILRIVFVILGRYGWTLQLSFLQSLVPISPVASDEIIKSKWQQMNEDSKWNVNSLQMTNAQRDERLLMVNSQMALYKKQLTKQSTNIYLFNLFRLS